MPADVELGIDVRSKGDGGREAASGLELVARKADDATDQLKQLDRKLIETRAALLAAGKSFAETGNASPFKSLLKDERQLTQVHKTLSRLTADSKKDLEGLGQVVEKGFFKSITTGITTGVQDGLQAAGNLAKEHPYIAAGIAGGILVGLPVIAGALEAAVAGGGIAAGVLIAAKDERTKAAWRTLFSRAGDELTGAASPFVDVAVRAADTFGKTFDRIMPTITKDFVELAPVADKLAQGAAQFVERLMPGIDALVRSGGPVVTMLADELPRLGAALSIAFKDISSAARGGGDALLDLIRMTEGSIIVLGKLTEITERIYEAERAVVQLYAGDYRGAVDGMTAAINTNRQATVLVGPAVQSALDAVNKFTGAVALAPDDLTKLSQAMSQTKVTADSLAGQMTDKLLGSMLAIDQSTLGFAQSQTRLGEALKANHTDLDITHEKGQQLREAVLGVVAANKGEYDSMIAAGSSAQDAAAAYDQNTSALDKQLRKAGLTRDQVDQLIGKYRNVPANVDTTIATKGLTEAINSLDDAIRLANHLDGRVTTLTIEEVHRTVYTSSGSPPPSQYFRGLAKGGIIAGASGFIANGPTFLIGERTVPEVAIPAPNSGISQARADMLLGTAASYWGRRVTPAGGGRGGPPIVVNVYAGMGADGQEIGRQIVQVLNQQLRTNPAAAAIIKAALG